MKNSIFPKPDEFYVGYLPKAPTRTAEFLKKIIVVIAIAISIISLALVIYQRPFSTANFEYGITTTLKGEVFPGPVPHIKVSLGTDQTGKNLYQTILIVGPGKMGALQILKQANINIGGTTASICGYLIYGDGKALITIANMNDVVMAQRTTVKEKLSLTSMGSMTATGEIVDPKCYFGVMKPGEGKPHRSCAIRCISGGIPPLFHIGNTSEYFILLDENLQPLNEEVLPIVGDLIELKGEAMMMEEWKILKINTNELKNLSKNKIQQENLAMMESGMTFCSMK